MSDRGWSDWLDLCNMGSRNGTSIGGKTPRHVEMVRGARPYHDSMTARDEYKPYYTTHYVEGRFDSVEFVERVATGRQIVRLHGDHVWPSEWPVRTHLGDGTPILLYEDGRREADWAPSGPP